MKLTIRLVVLLAFVTALGLANQASPVLANQASPVAHAASHLAFSGFVGQGNPTFVRPASCNAGGFVVPYATHTFTVGEADTYEFLVTATASGSGTLDLYMHIYQGSFSAGSSTTNCLFANDDGGVGLLPYLNVPLNAGTYVLVISKFSASSADANYQVSTNLSSEPGPGCDAMINIPESAVGASMIADAPVYWKPGEITEHVLPEGTHVRAIGLDASGAYYQVLYVCDFLWVPASVVGKNYEYPWNGAELPTAVIDVPDNSSK